MRTRRRGLGGRPSGGLFLEQPHVLDREHGLIGEGRNETNLLLVEWVKGTNNLKRR